MTKKEYSKFINKLFYNTEKIYSITIKYYNKLTSKVEYKYINSPRGVIGKPYVNKLKQLIDPSSVFDIIKPNEDIEINENNISFHCGRRIQELKEIIINGIKYSGNITVGYEDYNFLINRKYIIKYQITFI